MILAAEHSNAGNRRKEQILNWHAKVQNVHWAWMWKRYGL
jgi:hypothetical protein